MIRTSGPILSASCISEQSDLTFRSLVRNYLHTAGYVGDKLQFMATSHELGGQQQWCDDMLRMCRCNDLLTPGIEKKHNIRCGMHYYKAWAR